MPSKSQRKNLKQKSNSSEDLIEIVKELDEEVSVYALDRIGKKMQFKTLDRFYEFIRDTHEKRVDCINGEISPEEYKTYLNKVKLRYFPNPPEYN